MTGEAESATRSGSASMTPPFDEWPGIVARNRALFAAHSGMLSGMSFRDLRSRARSEFLEVAGRAAARMGFPDVEQDADRPLVLTGHQPELYHCGVWFKVFAAARLAEAVGGSAYEAVVDTDTADAVSLRALDASGEPAAVDIPLARLADEQPFFCAAAPDPGARLAFEQTATTVLSSLPDGKPLENLGRFMTSLEQGSRDVRDLAESVVSARRRIELAHGVDVPGAPVSEIAQGSAYLSFVAHVLLEWDRFAGSYNAALARFRTVHRTRSSAQPFPDLAVSDGVWDTVFWMVREGRRGPLRIDTRDAARIALVAPDGVRFDCDRDIESIVGLLSSSGIIIAPKAVALTLYLRTFVADVFIHGTGGGRYDEVTDDVILHFLGMEPPALVVATMDIRLSSGILSDDVDPAAVRARLNRLAQNPDEFAGQISMLGEAERAAFDRAAEEKRIALAAISREGSDRKSLGMRIKRLNAEMAQVLAPVREALEDELADAEAREARRAVLGDRTYSWCLFEPGEVDLASFGGR